MYEAFYGFKEKPFSMLPDPDFLYLSKKHQAALTLLEYGLLNQVGFCVISGEPGAGKTTILRALLERIGDNVTVGLITNTHQSFGGLLDWVLSAFGLHRPNLTQVEMHQIFMDYLIAEYANNRTVMLIVDEAQNMAPDALEELRMLSNINSAKDQIMQVILAGQPALKENLRKPELMQFAQRIAVDYHLDSLSLEETCGYIQHRLHTAGATKNIFTPAACARIHTYSGGTPRLINLLCETVLVYGFADQQEVIDVDLVDEMVQERMKDSVVPIVNRDAEKQDDEAVTRQLEKDFPWIQAEEATESFSSPVNETVAAAPEIPVLDEVADNKLESKLESKAEKAADPVVNTAAHTASNVAGAGGRNQFAADIKKVEEQIKEEQNIPAEPMAAVAPVSKKASVKPPAEKKSDIHYNDGSNHSRYQLVKYGVIAVIFAFVLVAIAIVFGDEIKKTVVVHDETSELQKQREQEKKQLQQKQLQQLQLEAQALKKERDDALAKIAEEKRAQAAADKLAAEKAEQAEKAVQAAKAAEEKRRKAEKKRIVAAKKNSVWRKKKKLKPGLKLNA